jgi:peptidoglycan LD-endopeptidase CwlK
MPFTLDARSRSRLDGVHPDLARVIECAAVTSDIVFIVTEGLRTPERQAELVKAGASRTLQSRHLTGHAVDLAVKVGNEVRWDWPLYDRLSTIVKAAAQAEGVAIEWGGDWPRFRDGPHYQLTSRDYPAPKEV